MLFLWRPSAERTRAFLASQAGLDFTYQGIGASSAEPPAGYVVDRTRACLGTGREVFEAAKAALARWDQFGLGWVEAISPDGAPVVGTVVAVVARTYGLWWLNACRVIYLIDDQTGPVTRYGFAYGTLPGHAESGEERFLMEWNQTDDTVWYDILAFSRPRHILARLGYRIARRMQKRFARDSVAAVMKSASGK